MLWGKEYAMHMYVTGSTINDLHEVVFKLDNVKSENRAAINWHADNLAGVIHDAICCAPNMDTANMHMFGGNVPFDVTDNVAPAGIAGTYRLMTDASMNKCNRVEVTGKLSTCSNVEASIIAKYFRATGKPAGITVEYRFTDGTDDAHHIINLATDSRGNIVPRTYNIDGIWKMLEPAYRDYARTLADEKSRETGIHDVTVKFVLRPGNAGAAGKSSKPHKD